MWKPLLIQNRLEGDRFIVVENEVARIFNEKIPLGTVIGRDTYKLVVSFDWRLIKNNS